MATNHNNELQKHFVLNYQDLWKQIILFLSFHYLFWVKRLNLKITTKILYLQVEEYVFFFILL